MVVSGCLDRLKLAELRLGVIEENHIQTVLTNGIDLEGLPDPDLGNLACRYYKNGLPSVQTKINTIADITKK